ncbi:MAG TPA: LacI family DNA-binding transcriptional regulator [Acidimicrobiales bacterium]|nr:LacI family DNA-binding transcriptional regulator [Acidimicrobiales bacterium]
MPRRPGPGPRRPTIADIAKASGVSKGSVSYALNGKPGLSEPTRRRILAVAEEIGWRPNRAARALSASRAGACGLLLARPAHLLAYDPFFPKLISGIEAELSTRQIALMLQIVDDVEAETRALHRWWAERRVDGVLLVDLRVDDPRVPVVEQLGMPAVIVGGPGATGKLPFFHGHDAERVYQIVEHLVVLGHRRIDRVAGTPAFAHTQTRDVAFKAALSRAGAKGGFVPTDYTTQAAAAATRKLLRRSPPPTAIIYDNDIMAVAGLGVAQEAGVDIPEELSIVSFEDSILCEVVRPSLTACAWDVEAFGATAACALISLMDERSGHHVAEKPEVAGGRQEGPVLVARASTGPAPEILDAPRRVAAP